MYYLQAKTLCLQYSTYFFYFLLKNKTSTTKSIFLNPPDSPRSTVPVWGTKTGTVVPNTVPVSGTKTGTVASNTVPVLGAQTGTANTPAVDTVPVTVPVIVPVSGTKTGTV